MCTCEKQEVGQGLGTVKGYIVIVECDECKTKRESENIIKAEQDAEKKIESDREAKIQAKSREQAIAALQAEGKL